MMHSNQDPIPAPDQNSNCNPIGSPTKAPSLQKLSQLYRDNYTSICPAIRKALILDRNRLFETRTDPRGTHEPGAIIVERVAGRVINRFAAEKRR